MKTTDLIYELQALVEKYGDCDFHVYGSFQKKNLSNMDVFYDDAEKDICIGVYA